MSALTSQVRQVFPEIPACQFDVTETTDNRTSHRTRTRSVATKRIQQHINARRTLDKYFDFLESSETYFDLVTRKS